MDKTEHDLRVHELKLRDANVAHERFHREQALTFGAVLSLALAALQSSAVLNGGAAVATLAFIGALLTSADSSGADYTPLVATATAFGSGVLLTSLASGFAYLAQRRYLSAYEDYSLTWECPFVKDSAKARCKEKVGDAFGAIATALVILSYGAFVAGGLRFGEFAFGALRDIGAAPT